MASKDDPRSTPSSAPPSDALIDRFASLSPHAALEIASRVRAIGLDGRYLASFFRVGERVDDAMRAPMRLWTARKRRDPAAFALRMFVLGDAVDRDDAHSALGDLAPYLESGLLVARGETLVSPFRMSIAFDRYFFADDLTRGGDAVMGPSATTAYLANAARPSARIASLLEIGCGAGAIAIALADRCDRVVATDINPRALVFAALNAKINGVTNIDLRVGDLVAPVRGESFELVIAQPPFVARTSAEADAPFLHGGERGDELSLRLLACVGDHIAPHGRAIFLVDWPLTDEGLLEHRIRRAIPEADMSALVLSSPSRNLEDHCTFHAAAAHPTLDADFANAALAMRDHFDRLGVRALALSLVVLARADAPPGFAVTFATRHFADAPPTAIAIDRIFQAFAHLHIGGDALLDARVMLAPDITFDEPSRDSASPLVLVRFGDSSLASPLAIDPRALAHVRDAANASSLRAALAAADDKDPFARDVTAAVARGILHLMLP